MPIRFYLSLVTMRHPTTAKHVNLVCSPIPLRSSTEYGASTIPYSCRRRRSSSHSPQPDWQRPIMRPKMMMIACRNYRRWMMKMTRRMILMWMTKTMRRKKICLLNWMTTKGRNWSITQRLSARCWTRCVWMFLLFAFALMSVAAIGSQTLLRRCPFHHHCPSRMAWCLCRSCSSRATYPLRCQNSMEFNIWYAECSCRVSRGHWWHYCQQIFEAAAVWAWWWELGHN